MKTVIIVSLKEEVWSF